jgi:glycosyltransferase involved in cell wall biosynthesis
MITGVYYPEINGAVLQCKQVIRELNGFIIATVLTSTSDESLKSREYINGALVVRVLLPKYRKIYYIKGLLIYIFTSISLIRKTELVHIHGYSKRNAFIIVIARLCNRKVVLKMTSIGIDDAVSVKNKSSLFWLIFKCCHKYIGISPAFTDSYIKSGLKKNCYKFLSNGIDLTKYYPLSIIEKKILREKYGFSENDKIIIFVGHFSHEKRPTLLFEAWMKLLEQNIKTKIIFIGKTSEGYEIDANIAKKMREDSINRGVSSLIHFIEKSSKVNDYLNISDIFVLPSIREGLPNALLEAMACELPCIVTYIRGVTDWLIQDEKTGEFIYSNDPAELAKKIKRYVTGYDKSNYVGKAARESIESNFSSLSLSYKLLNLYINLKNNNY